MEIKNLIDYEIIDEDINCKCVLKSLDGKPFLVFNCLSKYKDRAEETISEIFADWILNGGTIKDAIKRRGSNIVSEY